MVKSVAHVLERIAEIDCRIAQRAQREVSFYKNVADVFDWMGHKADFDGQHDYTRIFLTRRLEQHLPFNEDDETPYLREIQDRVSEWLHEDLAHSDRVVIEAGAVSFLTLLKRKHLNFQLRNYGKWLSIADEFTRSLKGDPTLLSPKLFSAAIEGCLLFRLEAKIPSDIFSRLYRASEVTPDVSWWPAILSVVPLLKDERELNTLMYVASICPALDCDDFSLFAEAVLKKSHLEKCAGNKVKLSVQNSRVVQKLTRGAWQLSYPKNLDQNI